MSLPVSAAQNQAVRHGDRRHAASIASHRKNATASPRQQAEAIAAIVRKRLADGQSVPDLDRYRLDDATWAELLDILPADELSTVADACGADGLADSDNELTADDVTMAFGDVPWNWPHDMGSSAGSVLMTDRA